MKILYVHGFGSHYDPNHEKIKMLETLGTVVGVDVDYCKGFDDAFATLMDAMIDHDVDLIVGTSMGGYMATHLSAKTGKPFVALNPATAPNISLQKWVGTFTDYAGHDRCLTENTVATYPDIATDGYGMVFVESADEIINASDTMKTLRDVYQVKMFGGGSHRFTHMEKALPMIKAFYTT